MAHFLNHKKAYRPDGAEDVFLATDFFQKSESRGHLLI